MDPNVLQVLSNVAAGLRAAMMLSCGLFGTYFYRREAGRRIRRLLDGCRPQTEVREQTLAAAGGPSLVALILALGAVVALAMLEFFMLMSSPSVGTLLSWLGISGTLL